MGPRVPRVLVNLVERKFACTRTKVQNHGEGWNDRSEEAREREGEGGWKRTTTLPFFRIDVSFLCSLGDTGNPSISPRAFKSWKPERKSNFARGRRAVDRRGGDDDDDEGERILPLPLLENTDSPRNAFEPIEAPNRLPFRFLFSAVYA